MGPILVFSSLGSPTVVFSATSFADDIRDFQIEGISIGDSLLDYISEKEILSEIEINKPSYNYLTDEFGEVYLYKNYEKYNNIDLYLKSISHNTDGTSAQQITNSIISLFDQRSVD